MKRLFAVLVISALAFAQTPAPKKEDAKKGCADMACCKEMKEGKDHKDHKDHDKKSDKEAKKMDCCANMGKEGDMCARKPMKEDKETKKEEKKS